MRPFVEELEDFLLLVEEMRTTQKRYFDTRDKQFLIMAKTLERQVDKTIQKYSEVIHMNRRT
jgi:hypothetical protein